MPKIHFNGRAIGPGEPVFVIAEAGVNHNGSLAMAMELVDAAVSACADAVKFQTFKAESLAAPFTPKAAYQLSGQSTESQFEMLKKLELGEHEFIELKRYCDDKRIVFMSTPHDDASLHFLSQLGVPLFKVASGDLTNLPFLRRLASKEKPIILSTGMASMSEIEEAVAAIFAEGNRQLILLQCTSSYPAKDEECNLRAMATLEAAFKLPVGFSDHSLGAAIALAAVAIGAVVLEKHFTLDAALPGPDHKMSLEPGQLKQLVADVRRIERARGDGIKCPMPGEMDIAAVARKSLVAVCDISEGTRITAGMIAVKRPGTGIKPAFYEKITGMTAVTDIRKDTLIEWSMLRE